MRLRSHVQYFLFLFFSAFVTFIFLREGLWDTKAPPRGKSTQTCPQIQLRDFAKLPKVEVLFQLVPSSYSQRIERVPKSLGWREGQWPHSLSCKKSGVWVSKKQQINWGPTLHVLSLELCSFASILHLFLSQI